MNSNVDEMRLVESDRYISKGSTEADLEYRAHQVPQRIAAYRVQHPVDKITPPPCNQRHDLASKDSSSVGIDTAPRGGSPLKREPAIRNASANPDLVRIKTNGSKRRM